MSIMKVAQFRAEGHGLIYVMDHENVCTTLEMFTRISEWVEVEFPPLPPEETLPKALQALDREERELREKLSRVAAARASLQPAA